MISDRRNEYVIASEAKQSNLFSAPKLDCFVASLLAMTVNSGEDESKSCERGRNAAAAAT